ncbi:hypothetical protein ABPG72_017768 [Tetrahymena utriculariae]
MSNQKQTDSVQNTVIKPIKDQPDSNLTLIPKISEQKPFLEINNLTQSLTLKEENQDAELKLVDDAHEKPKRCINAMKKEPEKPEKLIKPKHLQKIDSPNQNDHDIEEKEEEEIDKVRQNEEYQEKKLLILERKKMMRNLKNMLELKTRRKNYHKKLNVKLALKMLDGQDLVSSRNILQREIKPQNSLTHLIGIKHSKKQKQNQKINSKIKQNKNQIIQGVQRFALAGCQFENFNKLIKHVQSLFGTEIEKRLSKILEFDILIILRGQRIQQNITEAYQGKGKLVKFKDKRNRKSNIFQFVEICFHQKYQQRKTTSDEIVEKSLNLKYHQRKQATEFILLLIRKQQNKPNFMAYSAILPNVEKGQAKVISLYNLKKQANESIQLDLNELLELFWQMIFNKKGYDKSFEVISNSSGIILKIVKRVQDYVLKISTVEETTKLDQEKSTRAHMFQTPEEVNIDKNKIQSKKIQEANLKDLKSRMLTLNDQQIFYQITQTI